MRKFVVLLLSMVCGCEIVVHGDAGTLPDQYDRSAIALDAGIYQSTVLAFGENCALGLTASSVMNDYEVVQNADGSNSLYSLATTPKTALGTFQVGLPDVVTLSSSSSVNSLGCDFTQSTILQLSRSTPAQFTIAVTQNRSNFRQDGSSTVCKPPVANACTISYGLSLKKR